MAGYLLTSAAVAASLVLATLADDKLGAPPSLRAGPLVGPLAGPLAGSAGLAPAWGGDDSPQATGRERDGPAGGKRREPADAGPVTLAGVMAGRPGSTRLALVSVDGASALLVRPGDTLPGGYKVLAMDEDSMTYQSGERTVRLRVQAAERAQAALPAPAPAPPPASGDAAPGLGASAANGNEAFRQALEQRLASARR